MKIFMTGATGFIGGEIARRLRARGDEVVALVRNPEKAKALQQIGCQLAGGDLTDSAAIHTGMQGADAVIHCAAVYDIGIPASQRPAMYDANVKGTENVLGAALELKVPKVVYVSTIGAFGNTEGQVVDETYKHKGKYISYYDETKHLAHLVAERLIAGGLPCVIVQPGGVYGPDDQSAPGKLMRQFLDGKLPAIMFPDTGFNMVHRDDVADGVLLALDQGKPGEAYVLGGEVTTIGGLITTLAKVSGRKPPRVTIPGALARMAIPFGPVIGKAMGLGPNLREMITASDGVTYWAKHDKAMRELGYAPRGLEQGLRDMLAAEGRLPVTA
jgi:dihydroflavonol-4-reductase